MTEQAFERKRWTYYLQTVLYLSGMALLMGGLGYAFLGVTGLLWAVGLGALMMGFGQRVPTHWIMRMYRARRLSYYEAPQVFEQVRLISQRAGLDQVPSIYYLPSRAMNAFATGTQNDTAVAVTSGLVQSLNQRELNGVLAHEISHIQNKDLDWGRLAMILNRMTRLFAFMGQILLIINLPLFFMGEDPFSWTAILLLILAPYMATMLQLAISRTRELDADLQAVRLTNDPMGLASALERIEWLNKGGMGQYFRPVRDRMRQIPSWLRTHPTTKERVKRLREMVRHNTEFIQTRIHQDPFQGYYRAEF
ncbi:MAG: zinc metalloprotease HtpX [Bacteroidota bacterium]